MTKKLDHQNRWTRMWLSQHLSSWRMIEHGRYMFDSLSALPTSFAHFEQVVTEQTLTSRVRNLAWLSLGRVRLVRLVRKCSLRGLFGRDSQEIIWSRSKSPNWIWKSIFCLKRNNLYDWWNTEKEWLYTKLSSPIISANIYSYFYYFVIAAKILKLDIKNHWT